MDISVYKVGMEKAINHLQIEFKSIQVGVASSVMLENINVQTSYGFMKIPQLSHISIMDSKALKVEPWDKKEINNIQKAIYDSNLGLAPQNEGSYLIVRVPEVTKERRQEIAKQLKTLGEDNKAQIRRIRHDAMNENKKLFESKQISEDEKDNNEFAIDDLTKSMSKSIDDIVDKKSKDILSL